MTDVDAPLAGLRVVEFGHYIAAPFAASILADQGADVVKVERPGGDPYRAYAPGFVAWNWGKQTRELDLRTAAGAVEARALVDDADVVIENLRPGALTDLGIDLAVLRRSNPRLVTCSITAWGRGGPSWHTAGWEPLVHARAGAQQGMFTAERAQWLPFPMASVGAALFAVLGIGAALVKREATGYGQHVETSLLQALLYLNAGAILRRPGKRNRVVRDARTPVLNTYATRDGRYVQVNLSGTERWRELSQLIGLDDDDELDFTNPASLAKLSDRAWREEMTDRVAQRFAEKTADEWEAALAATPAAVAKCNTLEEWLEHPQAASLVRTVDDGEHGPLRLVQPPPRPQPAGEPVRLPPHGFDQGALGGHRVIDVSSFWAGPLAARLLAELGADVVKVEPPGGEGAFHLVPALPNVYMDGNRSKRGMVLDLRDEVDRRRLLDMVAVADVVVENSLAGSWERLDLGVDTLRDRNPALIYARAKGFGIDGPMASRPSFDYVVQAATGMVMTQGAGGPHPTNFTANDYATGIHLAVGIVLALLARARGGRPSTVEASLALSATTFQAEHVAELALQGARRDAVGPDRLGPDDGWRLYEVADGWITVCAASERQQAAVAKVAKDLPAARCEDALAMLAQGGVPAAKSVHPSAVPDDPQVRALAMLATVRHPAAGPFEQVGIPLRLSVDVPAVRGPAPSPAPIVRRKR